MGSSAQASATARLPRIQPALAPACKRLLRPAVPAVARSAAAWAGAARVSGTAWQDAAAAAALPGEAHESEGGNIYVGDYLADTLTAKSLDLPPGAAQVPPACQPGVPECTSAVRDQTPDVLAQAPWRGRPAAWPGLVAATLPHQGWARCQRSACRSGARSSRRCPGRARASSCASPGTASPGRCVRCRAGCRAACLPARCRPRGLHLPGIMSGARSGAAHAAAWAGTQAASLPASVICTCTVFWAAGQPAGCSSQGLALLGCPPGALPPGTAHKVRARLQQTYILAVLRCCEQGGSSQCCTRLHGWAPSRQQAEVPRTQDEGDARGTGGKLARLVLGDGLDVRKRTSGILERDREDLWDEQHRQSKR